MTERSTKEIRMNILYRRYIQNMFLVPYNTLKVLFPSRYRQLVCLRIWLLQIFLSIFFRHSFNFGDIKGPSHTGRQARLPNKKQLLSQIIRLICSYKKVILWQSKYVLKKDFVLHQRFITSICIVICLWSYIYIVSSWFGN